MPRKPTKLTRAQYAELVESHAATLWAFRHAKLAGAYLPNEWAQIDTKPTPPKTRLTLRVDADVARFFRKLGAGYQGVMNEVLRAFMLARLVEVFGEPDDPFAMFETDADQDQMLELERGLRVSLEDMVKRRMGWMRQE